VEDFVANRGDPAELDTLLKECVADGSLEGLACARRLYESDYGGVTFSWELKAPAASTLVMWGEVGIQALLDGARHYPSHKNISLCAQLLASLAAGSALTPLCFVRDHALAEKIERSRSTQSGLADFCRARLVDLVLSIDSDDDVAYRIAGAISNLTTSEVAAAAAKELFAALSARWLAVSKPVLERYEALILKEPDNEPAFQRFLWSTRSSSIPWQSRSGRTPISSDFAFPISSFAAPIIAISSSKLKRRASRSSRRAVSCPPMSRTLSSRQRTTGHI